MRLVLANFMKEKSISRSVHTYIHSFISLSSLNKRLREILSLGSLEILDSIFEFADPENLTIQAEISSSSCAELKSVHFSLFLAIFGCHIYGNSLGSLEIFLHSIFEFANPENLTIHAKN